MPYSRKTRVSRRKNQRRRTLRSQRRRRSQRGGKFNKDTCVYAHNNPSWKNAPTRLACRALYGAPKKSTTNSRSKGVAFEVRHLPGTANYTRRTVTDRRVNPAFLRAHGILDTRKSSTAARSIQPYLRSKAGTPATTYGRTRNAAMTAALTRLADKRRSTILKANSRFY